MAKLNPKDHSDGYKDQKAFDRVVPIAGTYDVVNVKLQRQKVGENATPRLRIFTHVLKTIETKNEEEARKMVGNTFPQDIWLTIYKDGNPDAGLNFNGQRLVNLAMANGHGDAFDPDEDKDLVEVLTAVPYRIKIDVETRKGESRDYHDVIVQEVKHLTKEGRAKYTSAPDWKKVIGEPEKRMLEEADYTPGSRDRRGGKRGGSSGGGRKREGEKKDDGFVDDDLPF